MAELQQAGGYVVGPEVHVKDGEPQVRVVAGEGRRSKRRGLRSVLVWHLDGGECLPGGGLVERWGRHLRFLRHLQEGLGAET